MNLYSYITTYASYIPGILLEAWLPRISHQKEAQLSQISQIFSSSHRTTVSFFFFSSSSFLQWEVPCFALLNPKLLSFWWRKGVHFTYYIFSKEANTSYALYLWGRGVQRDCCSICKIVSRGRQKVFNVVQLGSNAQGSFFIISELVNDAAKDPW